MQRDTVSYVSQRLLSSTKIGVCFVTKPSLAIIMVWCPYKSMVSCVYTWACSEIHQDCHNIKDRNIVSVKVSQVTISHCIVGENYQQSWGSGNWVHGWRKRASRSLSLSLFLRSLCSVSVSLHATSKEQLPVYITQRENDNRLIFIKG